jgi:hypothetical protein
MSAVANGIGRILSATIGTCRRKDSFKIQEMINRGCYCLIAAHCAYVAQVHSKKQRFIKQTSGGGKALGDARLRADFSGDCFF